MTDVLPARRYRSEKKKVKNAREAQLGQVFDSASVREEAGKFIQAILTMFREVR